MDDQEALVERRWELLRRLQSGDEFAKLTREDCERIERVLNQAAKRGNSHDR